MRNLAIAGILLASIVIVATTSFAAPAKKAAKKEQIPASIMVENKRKADLNAFSIYPAGADDAALVSLKKPLSAGKSIAVSLKGLKSCNVTIAGTFADEGEAAGEIDLCKEKKIRLVD